MKDFTEVLPFGPQTEAVTGYLAKLERARRVKNNAFSIGGEPFQVGLQFSNVSSFHARWIENPGEMLRELGPVHDLHRKHSDISSRLIQHNGWYLDREFQDETVHGLVFQLPAKDRKPRYLAAVSDAFGNNGAMFECHANGTLYLYDDLRDAARHADHLAERYAEKESDYQEVYRAKQKIEDNTEEIKTIREELLATCREIRATCEALKGTDALKRLIREAVKRERRRISKLRREIDKLTDDYGEQRLSEVSL